MAGLLSQPSQRGGDFLMPRYHSLSDVQSRLPSSIATIDAVSEPNTTQVTAWMDEVEAFVEGQLATRYQVPITGSQSLLIVRDICADLTAYRVWQFKAMGVDDPEFRNQAEVLRQRAMEKLQALLEGTMVLPDQAEAPSSSTPAGTFPEPIFERDRVQW
jgi:phage gp36-like protein